MKKSIKSLLAELKEAGGDNLKGGYAAIRGGLLSTNDICDGSNSGSKTGCTNNLDCSGTTNTASKGCTNNGTCFH